MSCPACTSKGEPVFQKQGFTYHECHQCGTVFVPGGLPQANMVGGTGQAERIKGNKERIQRFKSLGATRVLDFGCGNGALVWECNHADLPASGYDPYNPEFSNWPALKFDLICMIEVVEHLTCIPREIASVPLGTVLYIESSFRNGRDIPNLVNWSYVNPDIGHCTIWSEHGLDGALSRHGFVPQIHFNQHARVYRK